MGAVDDELAVVDPELKIIGMTNVRVVDASVFPLMVSANPMLTVSIMYPNFLLLSSTKAEGGVAHGADQLLTYSSVPGPYHRREGIGPHLGRLLQEGEEARWLEAVERSPRDQARRETFADIAYLLCIYVYTSIVHGNFQAKWSGSAERHDSSRASGRPRGQT